MATKQAAGAAVPAPQPVGLIVAVLALAAAAVGGPAVSPVRASWCRPSRRRTRHASAMRRCGSPPTPLTAACLQLVRDVEAARHAIDDARSGAVSHALAVAHGTGGRRLEPHARAQERHASLNVQLVDARITRDALRQRLLGDWQRRCGVVVDGGASAVRGGGARCWRWRRLRWRSGWRRN